jgi:hypothetical protein
MADYSIAQLKAALADAGATGPALDVAAAISLAENSGMSLTATNTAGNSEGVDRGPFQINSYYHPDVSDACAFDLACAAHAMAQISDGFTNFAAWTTYKTGAYLSKLAQVQGVAPDATLAAKIGPVPIPNPFSIPGDAAGAVGDLLSGLAGSLKKIFGGAVFVAGGLALVVIGLWRTVAPVRRRLNDAAGEKLDEAQPALAAAALA